MGTCQGTEARKSNVVVGGIVADVPTAPGNVKGAVIVILLVVTK